MASKKSVVIAALIANGAIAVMKFVGFLLTSSPSMLSETFHSISDTGNQVFLLIGIRYGAREPDATHPFGYGKAQFFYAFLVSVLLFGIAGWESAKHGFEKIMIALGEEAQHSAAESVHLLGQEFPPVFVNYGVLLGAIVFESWALLKARQGMKKQMEEHDWNSYREAFSKTSDVTTLTAFTEDSVALGGAGFALLGIYLTETLQDPIYDAIGALLIGFLLMGFALALAWENKRLLLGEGIPEDQEAPLRDIVREAEGVERIVDFRSVYFGPNRILVAADVNFRSDLATAAISERIDDIERALVQENEDVVAAYIEVEEEGLASLLEARETTEPSEQDHPDLRDKPDQPDQPDQSADGDSDADH